MIRWFAGHPTAANLLVVLIAAAGIAAAPQLRRETFPEYAAKRAEIVVDYRGATAADVEEAICLRLIDALEGLQNLEELTCTAQDNRAAAVAEMTEGADFGRFLDDITAEVDAIDDLPDAADDPVVSERDRTDFVASISVAGPMSAADLKSYAEQLKDRLLRLPEISQVDIKGFSDRQLQIEIPEATLRQHGLSAAAVARAVADQSVDMPAGTIETRDDDVLIRFDDQRTTPDALAGLVMVSGPGGGELTLGDIATIRDAFEQEEVAVTLDGARAAVLEIRKTRDEDALTVMDAVQGFLAAERARAPDTVTLRITQDLTTIVEERLQMLLENGVMGLVLVLLVMSVFFRPRIALWAALGLPVAFLGAIVLMVALDYSINMITMVALLLAIGIVMDDSIVIADSIMAKVESGMPALEAVVAGTTQVAPGVLSSFITTVAVFGPLAFLSGEIGAVLKVLPVVLIAALAASLVEAFMILPHHLRHPMERVRGRPPSRFHRAVERRFTWLRERVVGTAADWAVRWRYLFAGLLLLALFSSAGILAGGIVKFEAFPEIDGDVLEARLLLPQGTPLAVTEAAVDRVAGALDKVAAELGEGEPPLVRSVQVRFGENRSAGESGAHVATVVVDLLGAEIRGPTLDEITAAWHAAIGPIPGMISLIIQEPGFGPAGVPIEIRLAGDDLDALAAASAELEAWIAGYAGTYNVLGDLRPGKPERRLTLREGARVLGLTARDVAGQLRGAYLGDVADALQVGPETYEVLVRHAADDRDEMDDLADFGVLLPSGARVPLGVVADIRPARGWARIQRIDGRRTVTVQANVDGRHGNAQAIVSDMRAGFLPDLAARHPGLTWSVEGQVARAAETQASIRRGFLIGLVGIFVVLAFQFRSYVEPVIVMVAIPLAFLGALWGHLAMGYNLSMPSIVGAASLAGIVVNNSILLVAYIKDNAARGMALAQAAGQASRDRFRAIFVSSTTTIAGLLPLLAETSTQAQVLKPLVISVGFGLMSSTVLVLLAIPALYAILGDLGLARAGEETDTVRSPGGAQRNPGPS